MSTFDQTACLAGAQQDIDARFPISRAATVVGKDSALAGSAVRGAAFAYDDIAEP